MTVQCKRIAKSPAQLVNVISLSTHYAPRRAGRAAVSPAHRNRGFRLCVTVRRERAVRFPSNRRPSVRLRRDETLLDVALPRLEILHAPLGLLTRYTHLVGHVVDALSAVELLVVRDAGGRNVYLVSA